ncbi:branched-chain amino acid ABC transporter permease [Aquibium sp. A9E412]|uniref:branched-chain amino acid ABC transporter permease n=1 Tax=Aquibium sp. A9E412 TaxID=2976767 RepID=UPI0025B183B5|nr:branched-chain amino acid ABC transporter permease [Aquibium sp. A9E412]MDN2567303.1 branched-chain amino acid ABC transporter permease [Aquibium sp. A9E412]
MSSYLIAVTTQIGIYGLLTLSLSLQYGYTGLINFGQVGFYAIGAYAAALLGTALGWGPWGSLAAAALFAAVAAVPIGLLTLRLREDYLAIVTLGFAEVVRLTIVAEDWLTNGTAGISGIARPFAALGVGIERDLAFLALILVALVLVAVGLGVIVRSPFGRIVKAIRDDEDAVRVLGKEPFVPRIKVLCLGAAIAGFAGGLQAQYIGYVGPDQFISYVTFIIWIAMIIGGTRSFLGAIVGAGVVLLFLEGSRFLRDELPDISETALASARLAIVGLALILTMLYRPGGLVGGKDAR